MKAKEDFLEEVLRKIRRTKDEVSEIVYPEGSSMPHDREAAETLAEEIKLRVLDSLIHDDPLMVMEVIKWGKWGVILIQDNQEYLACTVVIKGQSGITWLINLAARVIVSEIIKEPKASLKETQAVPRLPQG